MADSFAYNIAEKVLGKLGSLAYQEVCLALGVKSELHKLEETLSTIKAVLLDAEEQKAKNHALNLWLGKLKDVCYDAEDVLDEFEYHLLRWQVVNQGGIKRKVCNFFSHSNPLVFHFKMGHKIKDIRVRIDEIAVEKAKFNLTERIDDRRVGHREMTDSFVRESDVIGRDNDKKNIIELLVHSGDGGNVSIIPIVGIGGLGKTTLAKSVYNDASVDKHFDLKMWVCVSDDFDVPKLIEEIIKSAQGKNCNGLTNDQLQASLRNTLDNKKFLLILDDVWNRDRVKWIKLRDLLWRGANGSKIIVTTRLPFVASIMGTVPIYQLEGLSNEDCLSLFVKWAFGEGEEKQYPNLVRIGEEIVKKCGGVPLAVRTLGSMLYLKKDEHDWLYVRDNEIWELEQVENDILPALKLSYDSMPVYLKQCFASCSLFPKDHQFVGFGLIEWWIAQGLLVSPDKNQDLEDIGQNYVKELQWRSFFQDFENYEVCPSLMTFRMHDLIHDLALSVAQTEYSKVNSRTHNISRKVKHVSFCEKEELVSRFILKLDNVRTIIFPIPRAAHTSQSLLETYISRFKYLRVLSLPNSHFKVLPTSIGSLKHLRLLDLCDSGTLKRLPNSIGKLQNLQSIGLVNCFEFEELPKEIGNLISLRNLYLTTTQMLLPEQGIGRLKSLRWLTLCNCDNLKSLGDGIQGLTALRNLFIENCKSLESLPRSMKYLTALETLIISQCKMLNLMKWEEDFQGIKFNLRHLVIIELPELVALPQWLQGAANTLQHIYIEECSNLNTLPEWLQNLTSLQKLVIKNCGDLSALPEGMHRLTALRELEIQGCPRLSSRCQRETGEDWPKIAHVLEITLDYKKIKSVDN